MKTDVIKNNLVALRNINRMTQQQVADYLGLSLNSYCNKENNNRCFTLEEAQKIATLFNYSIEDIFFGNMVFIMKTNPSEDKRN